MQLALAQKSAMIATLCILVGFFSSGCGQRGALYLPAMPVKVAVPTAQKEGTNVPPGLRDIEGSPASVLPQTINYSPGSPTVNVMEAPIFFESPTIHFPDPEALSPVASPTASSTSSLPSSKAD